MKSVIIFVAGIVVGVGFGRLQAFVGEIKRLATER